MSTSDLHSKTIRPGSLNGFSYYYSNRQPLTRGKAQAESKPKPAGKSHRKAAWLVVLLAIAIPLGVYGFKTYHQAPVAATAAVKKASTPLKSTTSKAAPAVAATTNECAGNTLDKFIKVSISDRHLWACEGSKSVYDSAVVTGMEGHASTLTPPGTYHIYSQQTDVTLTGSDETGSWNDPVSYWMPFLRNQYGTYGFHDATWRDDSAFGNIDPNSDDASHGCVELPLTTSAWLYNWAEVGTTVTIVN